MMVDGGSQGDWHPHRVSMMCDDTTARLREVTHWLRDEGLGGRQIVLERDRGGWPPRPLLLVIGFEDPNTALAVKLRWG